MDQLRGIAGTGIKSHTCELNRNGMNVGKIMKTSDTGRIFSGY